MTIAEETGNVPSVPIFPQTMTLSNGIVLTYGFDNGSRLTSMSYQLATNTLGTVTYSYDAAGRRTQLSGTLARTGFPQLITSAQYDVNNELTQWNGTNITYDLNGNIQNDGSSTYTWNARNQLSGRGSLTFQYDGYGRRIKNSAGNNLLYDGRDVTQELSGTTPIANRVISGTDEFASRTDSTGVVTPITDGLGSVLASADSSGNLLTQYVYDPFGGTSAIGSASNNTAQYTGRENDGNGLYYYRARYYSPQLGRFVSEDPIGWLGGINLYGYAHQNPMRFRDPSGLCTRPTCTASFVHHLLDFTENDTVREVASTAGSVITGVSALANAYALAMQQSALNYIYSTSQQGFNPFGNGMAEDYLAKMEAAQDYGEASEALGGLADGLAAEGVPGAVASPAAATVVAPVIAVGVIVDEGYALTHEMSDYSSGACVTELELVQSMLQ